LTARATRGRTRLLGGLAAGVLLVTAACGGDEEKGFTEDEEKAVAALTASLEGHEPEAHEKDLYRCISERVVDEVGVTDLKQSGLLTEDFQGRIGQEHRVRVEPAIADAIGRAHEECFDIDAYLAFAKEAEPRVPARAWEQYGECLGKLSDARRASITEAYTEGAGTKAQQRFAKRNNACARALARKAE
jgi:hypothetical protein